MAPVFWVCLTLTLTVSSSIPSFLATPEYVGLRKVPKSLGVDNSLSILSWRLFVRAKGHDGALDNFVLRLSAMPTGFKESS